MRGGKFHFELATALKLNKAKNFKYFNFKVFRGSRNILRFVVFFTLSAFSLNQGVESNPNRIRKPVLTAVIITLL